MGKDGSGRTRRSRRGTPPTWAVRRLAKAKAVPAKPLAHLKRLITEVEWREAKVWARIEGYQEEVPIQPTSEPTPEARLGPSKRQQTACCEVLPVKTHPLPYWPIPRVDEEASHRYVSAGGALTEPRRGSTSSTFLGQAWAEDKAACRLLRSGGLRMGVYMSS